MKDKYNIYRNGDLADDSSELSADIDDLSPENVITPDNKSGQPTLECTDVETLSRV